MTTLKIKLEKKTVECVTLNNKYEKSKEELLACQDREMHLIHDCKRITTQLHKLEHQLEEKENQIIEIQKNNNNLSTFKIKKFENLINIVSSIIIVL